MDLDRDSHYNHSDEDGRDSDAVDSDIEEQLYAQIYHRCDEGDVESSNESDKSRLNDDSVISVNRVPKWEIQQSGNPHFMALNTNSEVITVGSDSDEDNLCSRSMVAGKITRPADSSDSEISFLDISSDSSCDNINLTSDSVFRLGNVSGFHDQDDESAQTSESSEEDENDLQILDDNSDDDNDVIPNKPSSSKGLKSFLMKCKPSYSPSAEEKSKRQSERFEVREKADKVVDIKEVTLDLLNSLPGSNNRFKRMKQDKGESSDLWRLDIEDIQSNAKKRLAKARYYRQHRCNHCRDFTSHPTEKCPFPKPESVCTMCGYEGHVDDQCEDVICSKCFRVGHASHYCSFNFKNVSCTLCSLFGHTVENCSNHWRQYHLTTYRGMIQSKTIKKNVSRIWCANCGRKGHFAHECHQLYTCKSFWPTSPFLKPSSAMFNIKISKQEGSSKNGNGKNSRNFTVSTPATLKRKKSKCSDTPAGLDGISNLFNSSSKINPSNTPKRERTATNSSRKNYSKRRKDTNNSTESPNQTPAKKRKNNKRKKSNSTAKISVNSSPPTPKKSKKKRMKMKA